MAKKEIKKAVPKPAVQGTKSNVTLKKPVEAKQGFSLSMKLALLLGVISFMVYANTLKNGYVLDDVNAINKNVIVTKGISAIPEILSTPYRRGYWITPNDYYRPLSLVMFATEYQFFGKEPAAFHFFNILIFAGCVIFLFFFLDNFFERKKTAVAFIASLIYAVHPIHTEVVANIKSLDELLCFFFAFLSLTIFLNYIRTGKTAQLLAGALCFLLSFLSKETVISFLAVIPFIFLFYRNENRKRSIYVTITAVVVTVVFLCIRFSVLNAYHAGEIASIPFIDNPLAKTDLPYASRIATAISILGYDIRLLIIPYPLICIYSYNSIPFVNFGNPGVIFSLLFYISLIVFCIWRFRKDRKDPFVFGIVFFMITMSLFSNLIFLIPANMGERFMFFSSVGFTLIVALLIEKLLRKGTETDLAFLKNGKVLALIIPICLAYAVTSVARNSDWEDNYKLFSADLKKSPNDSKLYYYVGSELERTIVNNEKDPAKQQAILKDAITYLNKSLAIYPDFREAQADLGAAYFRTAQYDSAEFYGKKALAQIPDNIDAINNLAAVYGTEKKYAQCIELYEREMKIAPDKAYPFTNAGLSFFFAGNFDSGAYYLYKAIAVDPSVNASYEILASAYQTKGLPDSARKYEALARKNNPGFKL